MEECPLCGGRIKEGECRLCGFVPDESLFGDSRDELMEEKSEFKTYTEDERKEKISKSIMTLQSALMHADDEQDILSVLSSCICVFNLPLQLDPKEDFCLDDKECELLDMAEKLMDKVDTLPSRSELLRPEVYTKLGNAFYARDDMDRALELYDKTLEGYPRNEEALFNKAYVLFSKEEYDRAEHVLNSYLNAHPDSKEGDLLRELVKQLE